MIRMYYSTPTNKKALRILLLRIKVFRNSLLHLVMLVTSETWCTATSPISDCKPRALSLSTSSLLFFMYIGILSIIDSASYLTINQLLSNPEGGLCVLMSSKAAVTIGTLVALVSVSPEIDCGVTVK